MIEILLGLLGGATLGLCVAPLWMMLELPVRISDLFQTGSMRLMASALVAGATLGALNITGFLPVAFGIAGLGLGGVFVGMLSAALVEAVEVIPVLFDRLSISANMRFAALALAIGKAGGAILAALMGG